MPQPCWPYCAGETVAYPEPVAATSILKTPSSPMQVPKIPPKPSDGHGADSFGMREAETNRVWWRCGVYGALVCLTSHLGIIGAWCLMFGFEFPRADLGRQPMRGVLLTEAAVGATVFILIALMRNRNIRRRIAQRVER